MLNILNFVSKIKKNRDVVKLSNYSLELADSILESLTPLLLRVKLIPLLS